MYQHQHYRQQQQQQQQQQQHLRRQQHLQQQQEQQQQRQQRQEQQQHRQEQQQQASVDESPRSRRTSMDTKQQAANPPHRRPRTISQEKLLYMRLNHLHKEMEAALGRRTVLGVTLDRHNSNLCRVEDDVDQLDAQGRRVNGDLRRLIRRQCSDEARIGDLSREMLEVEIAV